MLIVFCLIRNAGSLVLEKIVFGIELRLGTVLYSLFSLFKNLAISKHNFIPLYCDLALSTFFILTVEPWQKQREELA